MGVGVASVAKEFRKNALVGDPSCGGRRMAERTADPVDEVLPRSQTLAASELARDGNHELVVCI